MLNGSLESRLIRLEACEAIRQLVAQYAIGADRKNDPVVLGPLFHHDAVWEAEGVGRYEGRDAIANGLSELGRNFVTWSIHYMISPLIEVGDDLQTASCRWYLWELCTMAQEGGEASDTWLGGWYDSRLSCRSGDWAFDQVKLDMRLASPVPEPWSGKAGLAAA